jgi:hypothetical protein
MTDESIAARIERLVRRMGATVHSKISHSLT